MKKNIFIYYQDIDSGAKIATEEIIKQLNKNKQYSLIIYKQKPFKYKKKFSFIFNLIISIKNLIRELNTNPKVDLIYSTVYWSYFSKKFSNKKNKPLIFHFHGDQQINIPKNCKSIKLIYFLIIKYIVNFLQTKAIKKSNFLIFVSKQSKKEILQAQHLKRKNVFVVNNGVDNKKFKTTTAANKKKIKNKLKVKGKTILYVGRIDHKKNIDKIIKSLNYLKKIKINLIIAYSPFKDKDSQKYLLKLKNLASNVTAHHTYFIENYSKLENLYQISDLSILPSRQEMMPLVMLESLACGTPFFGTNVGSISNILTRINKNYLLIDPNPKNIAKKINWLFSQKNESLLQDKNKTLNLIKTFTWEKSYKKLLNIFNIALKI